MLAAWFRLKYPHLLDGAIAASGECGGVLGEARHAPAPLEAVGRRPGSVCSTAGLPARLPVRAPASPAPIWTYKGEVPPYDPGAFAAIVTQDASPAGGSAAACAPNVRAAWAALEELGGTGGRGGHMGMCGVQAGAAWLGRCCPAALPTL